MKVKRIKPLEQLDLNEHLGKVERDKLEAIDIAINQYKKVGGILRIVGHASRRTQTNDPILHKMINFEVSASRAERVAREFVKMGMKSSKLSVVSVSDSQPRYHEYMPSGEAGNRRTEIYIDF